MGEQLGTLDDLPQDYRDAVSEAGVALLWPMMRYPRARTEAALRELAKYGAEGVAELDYVNPKTGDDVLPTMGLTAMYLLNGTKDAPPLRSSSAGFHAIGGNGKTTVNGETIRRGLKDTFTAPVFADIIHRADEDAFLVRIHDRPLQERLCYYEERT